MSVITRVRTGAEIVVPFTPEEVWSVVADVGSYHTWWPRTLRVAVEHLDPNLLGTVVEITPFVGPTFQCRIEELHPPRAIRIRYFGGALEGPGGLLIERRHETTLVRYELDVLVRAEGGALLSRVIPMKAIHSIHLRQLLRQLKRRLTDRRLDQQARGRATAKAARRAARREASATAPERRPLFAGLRGTIRDWLIESVREAARPVASPPPATIDTTVTAPRLSHFETARVYLEALSSGARGHEIVRFFASDAIDHEISDRFPSSEIRRDREAMLAARERSLAHWPHQALELRGATGGGSSVALEVLWRGVAGSDATLSLPPGRGATARRAIFLKFRDGLIVRQRAYDSAPSLLNEPTPEAAARDLAERALATGGRGTRIAGSNFQIARAYLAALSSRASASEIAMFFADHAVQEEFPNPMMPGGAVRNLPAILAARSRALSLLSEESFELRGATGGGAQVAMEVHWSGVVANATGSSTVGQRQEARAAMFLKLKDGLIVRQRNYGGFTA